MRDEDALGQHHVNADVSVHQLSNANIPCNAGQHISLVVAQMLLGHQEKATGIFENRLSLTRFECRQPPLASDDSVLT